MIAILHDFIYNNIPKPCSYGSIVYIGSRRASNINSRIGLHESLGVPGSRCFAGRPVEGLRVSF